MTDVARIEDKIDRPLAGAITVRGGSGVVPHSMAECMEVAKIMSIAQQAVPKHLRGQPGLCLGVVMQAVSWEMDVFAVARNSFVVNDQLSYMSQLIHAVIEQRAPLKGRLRCVYAGEGDERTCTVSGTFEGETEPHTYTTPKFKNIPTKNSPLWKWDVDQQMFYLASRAWARKWCPDVLQGVYTPDEAKYVGADATVVEDMVDNPLGGDDDVVDGGLAGLKELNGEAPEKPADAPKPKKATKTRAAPKDAPAATLDAGLGISDVRLHPSALSEAEIAAEQALADAHALADELIDAASHPNDIPYPAKEDFIRWAGTDYVAYLIQWCNLAAVFDGEGFLRETYIRDRHKKEMSIRNSMGTPLSVVERERVNDICRGACKGEAR